MRTQTIALIAPFDAEGRLLLLKRPSNAHCGDLWSFPGGKVESGEKVTAAAARELLEETSLSGDHWCFLGSHSHEYPDRKLQFLLYTCRCQGSQLAECESQHAWIEPEDIEQFPMPAANDALIEMLKNHHS